MGKHVLKIVGLFGLACLFAGVYGALHNQVSYTVAPGYFHQYKFTQFSVPPALHSRLGASWVGFQASWWMGIVIGIFVIPLGVFVHRGQGYVLPLVKSFPVVAATALLVGMLALFASCFLVNEEHVGEITRYGQVIEQPGPFLRASTMHNFSYLGGLLGIISGGLYLALSHFRMETSRVRP
jgi:hypothetical protein